MPHINPRKVEKSIDHVSEIYSENFVVLNGVMPQVRETIAARLRLLPDVVGKEHSEFLKIIQCDSRKWSNYINPSSENVIPWDVALDIKAVYRITLDWIYDGDSGSLPEDLRIRVHQVEKTLRGAPPIKKRGRPRKKVA